MKTLSKPTQIPVHPSFNACNIDDLRPIPGYHRNLPHLRLPNAIYFVTFRLADSIPKSIAEQWQKERHHWFEKHGIGSIMVLVLYLSVILHYGPKHIML